MAKDPGDDAKLLYGQSWPMELSTNAFNTRFNLALTRASVIGQRPIDDSDSSVLLRQGWWWVIAPPLRLSVLPRGSRG